VTFHCIGSCLRYHLSYLVCYAWTMVWHRVMNWMRLLLKKKTMMKIDHSTPPQLPRDSVVTGHAHHLPHLFHHKNVYAPLTRRSRIMHSLLFSLTFPQPRLLLLLLAHLTPTHLMAIAIFHLHSAAAMTCTSAMSARIFISEPRHCIQISYLPH